MIKAPFNFVPLNKDVYFPDWADKISQDIPFSDGMSGVLDLTITAETPIFVRNGHTQSDQKDKTDAYKSFSQYGGRFFIPGTSVKGCIRSVLETMSFGKMSLVQDERFSVRDFSNRTYRNLIADVKCGWLQMDGNGGYTIESHGKPKKVKISEVDNAIRNGSNSLEHFVGNADFKNDDNKMALRKYEIVYRKRNNCPNNISVDLVNVRDDELFVVVPQGVYVLTGQSSRYDRYKKKPKQSKNGETKGCYTGKFHEYLFPVQSQKTYNISEQLFKEFEDIHRDNRDYKELWKKRLNNGHKIPVFFIEKKGTIHSFGLTAVYKYPTLHGVHDGLTGDHKNQEKYDLADCIFGNATDLKGRVQFGHAWASGNLRPLKEETVALSSPHASYYPIYLGRGQSWDSKTITLAGRKRYVLRNTMLENNATDDMASIVTPLDKGTTFSCKLSYFNLRPTELGALLSALTFHGHAGCRHSIGAAKPLGYGRIRIKVEGISDPDSYIEEYATAMKKFKSDWLNTDQLKELFALSTPIPGKREKDFEYMVMDPKGSNDFKVARDGYRKNGEQLGTLTQILNNNVPSCRFEEADENQRKEITDRRIKDESKAINKIPTK